MGSTGGGIIHDHSAGHCLLRGSGQRAGKADRRYGCGGCDRGLLMYRPVRRMRLRIDDVRADVTDVIVDH